jgi:Ca2+/Na+ antiporter
MNNEIVVGAIFFIIGLIPAYYFYVKSIRIKEPIWSIKSNNLISGSVATLKNLSIAYKKHKVENLTVSKVFASRQ